MKVSFSHHLRSLVLFSILLFFASVVSAQQPLQPGYIISSNGDSLSGFLDLRGKAANARMIRFAATEAESPKAFYPQDIQAFGTNTGDRYESFLVDVNQSSYKAKDLVEKPEPTFKEEAVFLQEYVKGGLSLYFFKDGQDNLHFYLQKGEEEMIGLVRYRFVKKVWEKGRTANKIVEMKKYIGQLSSLMSDCEEIQKEFLLQKHNRLPWREAEIQQLVIRYNELMGHPPLRYKEGLSEQDVPHVSLGLLVGPSYSYINLKGSLGSVRTAHATADFQPNMGMVAGLFLNLQSSSNQGRWGFQAEALYDRFASQSLVDRTVSEAEYYTYDMQVDLQYLRLSTAVRYNYPHKSRLKPFTVLGLTSSLLLKETNSLTTDSYVLGVERHTVEPLFGEYGLRKFEWGTHAGVGLTKAPFMCELKYEYSFMGYSRVIGVASPRHSVYFLLGVFL